jgi:hypothetical protein
MPRPKGSANKKAIVKKTNNKSTTKNPINKPKNQSCVDEDFAPDSAKRACMCCHKLRGEGYYYASKSSLYVGYSKLPICKDCIDIEFESILKRTSYDIERSIYYLCMRLDYPFISSQIEVAKKQSEKLGTYIHRVYIQKINSFGETNNYGEVFLDGEILKPITKRSEDVEIEKSSDLSAGGLKNYITEEDVINDATIIHKWGSLATKDVAFLETEYQEWQSRYDISTKSMEILVKEICYQQLTIKKLRETGRPAEKELKTLQDLMGNTALKPIQESVAQSTEAQTLGTLIKKWENERPIPEPDKEFEDVDGIKKYLSVWFFGHLCRMMGIENDYSRQYDEETLKYTINLPEKEFDIGEDD